MVSFKLINNIGYRLTFAKVHITINVNSHHTEKRWRKTLQYAFLTLNLELWTTTRVFLYFELSLSKLVKSHMFIQMQDKYNILSVKVAYISTRCQISQKGSTKFHFSISFSSLFKYILNFPTMNIYCICSRSDFSKNSLKILNSYQK